MKESEIGKRRRKLPKVGRWLKNIVDLVRKLKALAGKIGKAFRGAGLRQVRAKIETIEPHSPPSVTEWMEKEKKLLKGLEGKILEMYARGMGLRDIQSYLEELCNEVISVTAIASIVCNVLDKFKKWKSEPLKESYLILHIDKVPVKIIEDGQPIRKFAFIATGVNLRWERELLGLWITRKDDKIFWTSVMRELQSRGVKTCFWAFVYNLNGFQEAIQKAFPNTSIQLCSIQMIRNILKQASYEDRQALAADLMPIYAAQSFFKARNQALRVLKKWGGKYFSISVILHQHWMNTFRFLTPVDYVTIQYIYSTHAMQSTKSIHEKIIKIIELKKSFPSDEAALGLIFLILKHAKKPWYNVKE